MMYVVCAALVSLSPIVLLGISIPLLSIASFISSQAFRATPITFSAYDIVIANWGLNAVCGNCTAMCAVDA